MKSINTTGSLARSATASLSAIAIAAAAAGCNSGDVTVSGVPSTPSQAPPPSAQFSPMMSDGGRAPDPSVQNTGDIPRPVPVDAPGYFKPERSGKEEQFLEQLEGKKIQTQPLADAIIAAGNVICRIKATGGAASQSTTIADAVAGQLVAGGYVDEPEPLISRAIVDSAANNLCP